GGFHPSGVASGAGRSRFYFSFIHAEKIGRSSPPFCATWSLARCRQALLFSRYAWMTACSAAAFSRFFSWLASTFLRFWALTSSWCSWKDFVSEGGLPAFAGAG